MKKKDILGHGWLSKSFKYSSEMKKMNGEYVGYSAIQRFLPETKELYTDVYGKNNDYPAMDINGSLIYLWMNTGL